MHDPMVVAHEIRRPWPTKSGPQPKPGQRRWEVTIYRAHGKDHKGWNPRRWWLPRSWSPFITAFGRRWYFPSLITVWHVEPKGHDSGEVCKHRRQKRNGKWVYTRRWAWHFWHWHIQISPLQKLKRFLFERCIECGRRYPWGYSPVSHQWDGSRSRWFRVGKLNYHRECSSLGGYRRGVEERDAIIRYLFDALVLSRGEQREVVVDLLTGTKSEMPFHQHYRLQNILGYERDENYKLVPAKSGR